MRTCECAPCPKIEPATPIVLEGCTGSPLGLWRSTSMILNGVVTPVLLNGANARTCPGEAVVQPSGESFALRLSESGKAAFSATRIDFTVKLALACVGGSSCGGITIGGVAGACTSDGCGLCRCASYGELPRGAKGNWSTSQGKVKLWVGSEDYPSTYRELNADVCVTGDKMTLLEKGGLVIELVRTNLSGTPTWCGARTKEECKAGDNCGPGSCEGDDRCSTTRNKSQCNGWAGCNWLDDLCGGHADPTCDLGYSTLLPGCSFVEGTAICEGKPASCAAFDYDSCSGVDGCSPKAKCEGTPSQPTQADGDPTLCDAHGGVYADGKCTGLTCENSKSQWCTKLKGCKYNECTGTRTPCSERSDAECLVTPGCKRSILP